ncbi:SpoIIE family protein phosphatase [Sphaerisporangium sp. TRM90804]|uniref:SpoIIE family protein phosphatase n=1 Tax=Sphaerisporangium sp. TRM90804 TaxID=3031113 RepID=UPI00244BF1D0|nr:SpoIIE family protein phosphatase [Sphaerisporangium sp. TRM90804]MDH2429123.1 SpoIIE family protein phosphatase [Sphaerisporangium sp. TRM90804]
MARATRSGPQTDEMCRTRPGMAHLAGFAALVLDRDGCVTHWGGGAMRLFGRSPERAMGHNICDLVLRGTRRDTVRKALAEVAAGEPWSDVLAAECADGQVHEVAFNWEPLRWPGPWGAVMVTAADASGPRRPGGSAAGDERLALLHELSTRISGTLDPVKAAEDVVAVTVPRFADGASICVAEGLLRDSGHLDHAADGSVTVRRLAHGLDPRSPRHDDWPAAFPTGEIAAYGPGSPANRCMATGTPTVHDSGAFEPRELLRLREVLGEAALAALGRCSFLVAPLTARGIVLGFIAFSRDAGRPAFDAHDLTLAADLASRAGICVDNARLYSLERRTAQALQQDLAPRTLNVPPGVQVAHRYLPASAMTVGGDWYDVISLSETRMALVIGDAMGHGPVAAGAMGQLRAAVRAFAGFDIPPHEVLRRLDLMAEDMESIQCATCLYATVDLATRTCALSRAGHPPPILVDPAGTASVLDLPTGLALGLGDPDFSHAFCTTEVDIPPGSTLALYTDGLVESREQDIDTGIATLVGHLSSPRATLEASCDAIIAALPHRYDDVALLLTRTT